MNSVDIARLINQLLNQRLEVLNFLEKVNEHHFVKNNVNFFIDTKGMLKYKYDFKENLSEDDKLNLKARIKKIYSEMFNLNKNYSKFISFIDAMPKQQKIGALKQLATATINQYDKVNDEVIDVLKDRNKIDKNFTGKLDVNKLGDYILLQKRTLILLNEYKIFEIDKLNQAELQQETLTL